MNSANELKPRYSTDQPPVIREAFGQDGSLNRSLYVSIGKPWGWTDKLSWADQQWRDYACPRNLKTFVCEFDGVVAGYYELHQETNNHVEIAYFGLVLEFIGRRLGGILLTHAIEQAWLWDTARVWVHTCSLDHPFALANYQARGMRVYATTTKRV